MRTRFHRLSFVALLVVGLVAGGVVSARPQEGFTVEQGKPVEKEYPAMGAGCPACSSRTGALNTLPTSSQCGGAYQWCDAIPVEVIVPSGLEDDRDIFFTIVELHWDGSAGNDLDVKFYDNGQSTGTTEQLGSSESTKNPEVVRVANADLGEYNIVVINYQGANTGYTIKARISTDPFESPTESLAPQPEAEEPEEPEDTEFEQPEDLSGQVEPSTPEDPTLAPVEGGTEGDDDFDFGFSDLNERITINAEDLQGGPEFASGPAPKKEPVSPAVLLASLVGAPALLISSGALFAWRRRQSLPV